MKIGIVSGYFNPLHFGHIKMINSAKAQSDMLIGIVNNDAQQMIREIKGYALLTGYRWQQPVDISSLEDLLLKVSDFAEQNPEIKEIDLNPVFAYSSGAVAVDARLILEEPS